MMFGFDWIPAGGFAAKAWAFASSKATSEMRIAQFFMTAFVESRNYFPGLAYSFQCFWIKFASAAFDVTR